MQEENRTKIVNLIAPYISHVLGRQRAQVIKGFKNMNKREKGKEKSDLARQLVDSFFIDLIWGVLAILNGFKGERLNIKEHESLYGERVQVLAGARWVEWLEGFGERSSLRAMFKNTRQIKVIIADTAEFFATDEDVLFIERRLVAQEIAGTAYITLYADFFKDPPASHNRRRHRRNQR